MSETQEGPGWWMASDHKWYPPHLHPDVLGARQAVTITTAQHPQPQPQPQVAQQWGMPAGAAWDGVAFGGKTARRTPARRVLLVAVLIVLAGAGVLAYLLTRSSTGGHSAAIGQPLTVEVDGTTLTMTISQLRNPAPGPTFPAGVPGVLVAFFVTLTDDGSSRYDLGELAFGLSQGNSSGGGAGLPTSAGQPFRQSGALSPGTTETGWVTGIIDVGAGPVTSVNVAFNARTAASPSAVVSRVWNVG